jgi:hypothetical protein
MTPLETALYAALTREWQGTPELRNAVSSKTYRPAMSDVAASLRRLRRKGFCEREARGTNGHAWRLAGSSTLPDGGSF